jgi:DNA-binding MarR family transcriptional regulator
MPDKTLPLYFRLFNEIGIVEQLSRAMFEARLPDGVLVSHFAVLNHLIRVEEGCTPLELAKAFQMPKTTMTHVLGQLEKRAWIETRPNAQDKRSKRIWTTQAGRSFRDDAIGALVPELFDVAGAFPAEQVAPLVEALEALRIWMDARR